MKTKTFENGVKTLTSAYGRVKLSPGFLSILWDSVGHIPDEAWNDIVLDIVKTSLRMPTINQILEAWGNWQNDNPNKMAKENYDGNKKCFCKGKGYYDFEYIPKWLRTGPPEELWKNQKLIYQGVCNCGDCKKPKFASNGVPFIKYQDFMTAKWVRLLEPFEINETGPVTTQFESKKRFQDLFRMIEDKTFVPDWARVLAKKYPKDMPLTRQRIGVQSKPGEAG
jgi:hypothetical protein